MPSCAHEGPLVVEERQALGRRQIGFDVRRQRAQQAGRVGGAIVATGAGIREHPRHAGAVEAHRARLISDHFTRGRRPARDFEADRNLPASALALRLVDEKALLLERDGRPAVRARDRHIEQRRTRLIDEGRQNALDRLSGGRGDRLPEVFGRRVRVRVCLKIVVDALPERVRADVALDHPQHSRALLVRDRVEGLVDLRRRLDVGVNRARRLQRIERQRGLILLGFVDRDGPVRMRGGERLVGHPGREAFVQPEVVPPLHRHEIAEPLVRHLVGQNRRDLLPRAGRGRLRVRQQIRLAIENRGGILHGARREIRHRHHVELSERVLDGVVAVVELQDLLRGLERDASQILLVRRRADSDGHAVGRAIQALEVPHGHRDEIRGHPRRCRELDRVLGDRGAARVGHDLPVRDRGVAAVDRQRDGERRLERRLVEARKRPARVGGLELRHGVLPELGLADVKAAQLFVQRAGVPDV